MRMSPEGKSRIWRNLRSYHPLCTRPQTPAAGQADHASAGITKHPANDQGRMESWEAIAISQALRLGQFWHACNMPLTAHRHVNGKPLKIGINWRKFVPFHPLDLQKTANLFVSKRHAWGHL